MNGNKAIMFNEQLFDIHFYSFFVLVSFLFLCLARYLLFSVPFVSMLFCMPRLSLFIVNCNSSREIRMFINLCFCFVNLVQHTERLCRGVCVCGERVFSQILIYGIDLHI